MPLKAPRSGRRRASGTPRPPTPFIALDASHSAPLHRQLYDSIRAAIVSGQLRGGSRLPSTRALAAEIGVSRVTVAVAFDQLRAEGYVEARTGSGTFVRAGLPDDSLHPRRTRIPKQAGTSAATRRPIPPPEAASTPRPNATAATGVSAFRTGLPALDLFPVTLWTKITARRWRGIAGEEAERLLGYGSASGYEPLRRALTDYVTLSRGVRCEPTQVIVTAGAQQALDLIARVLLRPGDAAWIEDPGYFGACETLTAVGADVVAVPVDAEGMDVAAGESMNPRARVAYVSPSHQYPLGVTMSMRRRLALLDWAERSNAWVIEDDYDSEFRYVGRPLSSLQGMDAERRGSTHGRVLYVGTFSKTLFPSLRLGYLIVPPMLVDAFEAAKAAADRHTSTVDQAVLTEFIDEGHYARHVRRMRLVYAARQETLISATAAHLGRWLDVRPSPAGMHLVGWIRKELLRGGISDMALSRAAMDDGVIVSPLSAHRLRKNVKRGIPNIHESSHALLLGYAGCSDEMIWEGAERLAGAISRLMANHS
jgi:GntR family transcriptional regulator/MocR family aminotransferase